MRISLRHTIFRCSIVFRHNQVTVIFSRCLGHYHHNCHLRRQDKQLRPIHVVAMSHSSLLRVFRCREGENSPRVENLRWPFSKNKDLYANGRVGTGRRTGRCCFISCRPFCSALFCLYRGNGSGSIYVVFTYGSGGLV